jgi:hypothetical protein
MHVVIPATLSSARSASLHDVHDWTHFKQASIAAATSPTSAGTAVGEASNMALVSVTLPPFSTGRITL